jgi:hypothetical protein
MKEKRSRENLLSDRSVVRHGGLFVSVGIATRTGLKCLPRDIRLIMLICFICNVVGIVPETVPLSVALAARAKKGSFIRLDNRTISTDLDNRSLLST